MGNLGERVRLYRQRARLSQTDLAAEDLSPSYISLIESGKRHPSRDVLQTLASRLGCSVTDLEAHEAPADVAASRLEISYARIALTNGEAEDARDRMLLLLNSGPQTREIEHDALLLLGEAHQILDDTEASIQIRQSLFDQCLSGRSHLPVPAVAYPLCFSYMAFGDLQAAVRVGERGIQASADLGLVRTDDHHKLEATVMLAYYELGDLALAWTKAEQIIASARESGSVSGQGAAYWNAALVAESRGELAQALHLSQRALALFSQGGRSRNLARLCLVVAWYLLIADPNRAAEAAALLDQCQSDVRDLGAVTEQAEWEALRALAYLIQGDNTRAEPLARRAVLHLSDMGDQREAPQALITLGDVLIARGLREQGLATYRSAVAALAAARPTRKAASLYREVAHRLNLAGDTVTAMECLQRALDVAHVRCNAAAGEIAFGLREAVRSSASTPEAVDPVGTIPVAVSRQSNAVSS